MHASASSVDEYLATLPEDRRQAISAIRDVILANLDKGYEEKMGYCINYVVPHSIYPQGYHCNPKDPLPYVGIASQKNYMSLYLFCGYVDSQIMDWFQSSWIAEGKKLDMGKSCIRFKKIEDVSLNLIGELIRKTPVDKFVSAYENALGSTKKKQAK